MLGLSACFTVVLISFQIKEYAILSKEGSKEELEGLRKIESHTRAAARGTAEGIKDATGTPRNWWSAIWWEK